MFKNNLQKRFERIFGFSKVTFLAPDYEAPEQDTLFIEITAVKPRMSTGNGGRETATVNGAAIVFSQDNRLPFGFFAKRVEQANVDDTKDLFFQTEEDLAASPARLQNIHERRVPFVFLYDSQYDPDRGELTDLEFSLEE